MKITANNPNRKSWLEVSKNSDFPIQNIPFGVFITKDDIITIGTRIGDFAIDLGALHQLGYFKAKLTTSCQSKPASIKFNMLITLREN